MINDVAPAKRTLALSLVLSAALVGCITPSDFAIEISDGTQDTQRLDTTADVALPDADGDDGRVDDTHTPDVSDAALDSEEVVEPLVFVVNTTSSVADSDGCSVTHCTLEEAVQAVNNAASAPVPSHIRFDIPATDSGRLDVDGRVMFVIAVDHALSIGPPVVLDGTSQPGFDGSTGRPVIHIDALGASGVDYLLRIGGAQSVVDGLSIAGGRFVLGVIEVAGAASRLRRIHLGLAPDGTPTATGDVGVHIVASDVWFGEADTTPAERLTNVVFAGPLSVHADLSVLGGGVVNTWFDTLPGTPATSANDARGILLQGNGVTVDQCAFGPATGVAIFVEGTSATITNNQVGALSGQASTAKRAGGIIVGDAATQVVISGNVIAGLEDPSSGIANGIEVRGTHAQAEILIQDNRIGLLADGPQKGNEGVGVLVNGQGVTLSGNRIVANLGGQITIISDSTGVADGTVVTGNRIGLLDNGNPVPQGAGPAVLVVSSDAVRIGTSRTRSDAAAAVQGAPPATCTDDCNIISGGATDQVQVFCSADAVIMGNYLNANMDGNAVGDPPSNAVTLSSTASCTNTRPLIADNLVLKADSGIHVRANGGNIVGNQIGITRGGSAGEVSAPAISVEGTDNGIRDNNIGFITRLASAGPLHVVRIEGTQLRVVNNQIGVAGGNETHGVEPVRCHACLIDGNTITRSRYGIIVNHHGAGIAGIADYTVDLTITANTIEDNMMGIQLTSVERVSVGLDTGGAAAPNTIANNTTQGILIWPNVATGPVAAQATIRTNAIHDNGGLGIDLVEDGSSTEGNPTANDPGDVDFGANFLMNFPQITAVYDVAPDLRFQGCAEADSTLDFYLADSGTSPEGALHVGSCASTASTPSGAICSYSGKFGVGSALLFDCTITAPPALALSNWNIDGIVATATDGDGNTSEFAPVAFGKP